MSVAQNVFSNNLVKNLVSTVPGLNPATVIQSGATSLRYVVDPSKLGLVLVAYNAALVKVFQVSLILACLSGLGAVFIEWRSVKGKQVSVGAA